MSFRRHILMGHRLSKTPVHGCNASKLDECNKSQDRLQTSLQISEVSAAEEPIISVEIPNSTEVHEKLHTKFFDTSAIASTQIIIKIQLTKMEGQETTNTECNKIIATDNAIACLPTNNNGQQVLNLNFNGNLSLNSELETSSDANCETSTRTSKFPYITTQHVSTGSPTFLVNNNFNPNVVTAPMSSNSQISENYNIAMGQMTDLEKRMSIASMVSSSSSNSEVAEGNTSDSGERVVRTAIALNNYKESRAHYRQDADVDSNEYCCRRKSKSTTFPSKWRCCKCTCRDAFKRIIDASSSKSSKKKERKEGSSSKTNRHTADHLVLWNPLQSKSTRLSNNSAMSFASSTSISSAATSADVIIPITSPQFVVVQCPPSSLVTLGRIDDNAIRLMATELVPNMNSTSATTRILTTSKEATYPNNALVATPVNSSTNTSPSVNLGCPIVVGPVVHSQVDYIHCLVPDLEKISKASFYWGKMDRYEAERLLEGKPEGTFLLRDSAQEEYLFSVTFRKYGRSLHARIEQSNHKFSFDCHDPCVFTAPTVTGLLEHYKDPACVMFFEPMLTIPLHRNTTFSLQQLCRATIVSHTNYDGINELELPSRLKSYLKEYHYKQKLRVKPFDEHFYSCI